MSANSNSRAVVDGKRQSHPVARLRSSPPDMALGVHTRKRRGRGRKKGPKTRFDIVITDYESNIVINGDIYSV
jgi:hypothetical protein